MLMLLALVPAASAGSIAAPGVIAGPESGPTVGNVAAVYYNPAALGALPGSFQGMFDLQMSHNVVTATTTRNEGIDPNTGEAYTPAVADVWVPVAMIGVAGKAWDDRLSFGVGATDSFVGGADYSGSEVDPPPYASHQRYAGIETAVIVLSVTPAVAITPVEGVHLGGGVSWNYDNLSALQASDPLHQEGNGFDGPYSSDVILEAQTSGSHWTWNAGVLFNRFEKAQVGVSYSSPGTFQTEGEGTVTVPAFLTTEEGSVTADALISFEQPMPAVIRVGLASQVNEDLTLGVGLEHQRWNACCGDQDGDLAITVTDTEGGAIDSGEGVAIEVATEQYSPRRLWNTTNLNATAQYTATDRLWLGARVGYNQNAVPDFAVSATNLDFESVGGSLAARYQVAGPVSLGATYTKFFPFTRTIKNSAWDADEDSAAYRDERFSPATPYKASTNGTYSVKNNIFGVRVQVDI